MKTILEHLSRFDTEGYTEPPPLEIPPPPPEIPPPPPEIPPPPPLPPRSRVVYDNMRPGQYGFSSETSRRPIVRRCAERLLHASAYRGRPFWADIEDSVPDLSAAPASVSDSVPPYTIPPVSWFDPAPVPWPDELGPPMNLDSVYASLLASANANPALSSSILGASYGPSNWAWVNQAPTPEPNAQS